jgi:hypothetical protein
MEENAAFTWRSVSFFLSAFSKLPFGAKVLQQARTFFHIIILLLAKICQY